MKAAREAEPGEAEPEEAEPQEAKQEEPGVGDAEAREEEQLMEDLDRQQEGPSEHGVPSSVSATSSALTSQGVAMTSTGPQHCLSHLYSVLHIWIQS